MAGEIVLHVGDRETGSSAIQAALAAGAATAPGRRVAYPARTQHRGLAEALVPGRVPPAEVDRRWREAARRLQAAEADIAVVSAESFESVDPALLARTLAAHLPDHAGRIRVIAYVRPHAERVLSSWAQMVKIGRFAGSPAEFHAMTRDKGLCTYAPRFAAWRAAFGPAFTLRPLIRDRLAGGDVVADFFTWLFAGQPFDLAPLPARNDSLGIADLAMLAAFHAQGGPKPGAAPGPWLAEARQRAGWYLASRLAAADGGTGAGGARPALDPALAARIVADYATDAAALDAAFFDTAPGETGPMAAALAAAPARATADGPPSLALADHYGPEAQRIITILGRLAGDMLTRDPGDWPAHFGRLFAGEMRAAVSGPAAADGTAAAGRRGGGGSGRKGAGNRRRKAAEGP